MDNSKQKWEESYKRKENFIFYPHEEIIRFFSKYIVKREGLIDFVKKHRLNEMPKVLDLGCGVGRHIVFSHTMKTEAYGIDISEEAISIARSWASKEGLENVENRISIGDISQLPYENNFFDFVLSHGVLDSMSYSICSDAINQVARVLKKEGLLYCDLISGDDSSHYKEYSGEEIVLNGHEEGTVQLYFNYELIVKIFNPYFNIKEIVLIRKENILQQGYISRYHLVLERK
jgi:ubiquinone/menaquinone biosynthesis C-methylase UbiE